MTLISSKQPVRARQISFFLWYLSPSMGGRALSDSLMRVTRKNIFMLQKDFSLTRTKREGKVYSQTTIRQ
ncbi:hypothetical protein LV92_02247 [Arenibacter echinorum]|jgi:hypothetical protein|uniref:Uncharacterized protein n=1 Tax=Arenibacter echinorum TaxID=440515 RepID=A0A327R5S1_9FLAO|nr:hypothetical protein LV92_02247 [Arenibacter echinorum]